MALIKSIIPTQHKIITSIMDLGVILFTWHDIQAFKGPIMTRSQLGTGHPGNPVTQSFPCEIFQMDIIPSFQSIRPRDALIL